MERVKTLHVCVGTIPARPSEDVCKVCKNCAPQNPAPYDTKQYILYMYKQFIHVLTVHTVHL